VADCNFGWNPGMGQRIFPFSTPPPQNGPCQLWGPPRLLFHRYTDSFPGVKRRGPDVNDSPPSSSGVVNKRSSTSAPPIRIRGVQNNSFTFMRLQQWKLCKCTFARIDSSHRVARNIITAAKQFLTNHVAYNKTLVQFKIQHFHISNLFWEILKWRVPRLT
jgi:hypothetical protein